MSSQSPTSTNTSAADTRAIRILAKSLFRQLKEQSYSSDQMIAFTSALLQLVHEDLQQQQQASDR